MTVCDSWKGDKHLVQMVSNLQKTELWKEHFDTDLQEPAEKIMMLTLHLLMNRVWTCSLFSLPPDAYAGLLSCDAEIRKTTALKAECHHKSLLRFESKLAESIPSVHARQLFTDLQVGISHPSRLFWTLWRQESREARELPRGCPFLRSLAAGAPQAHRNTWHNVFDSAPSSPKNSGVGADSVTKTTAPARTVSSLGSKRTMMGVCGMCKASATPSAIIYDCAFGAGGGRSGRFTGVPGGGPFGGGPFGGGPFGPWWGVVATSASSGGPFTGLGGGGPFGGPWGGESVGESNNSSASFGSAYGMPKTACV